MACAEPTGVQPVSPEELSGKVGGLVDSVYDSTKPVVAKVSMIIIALIGMLALGALFMPGFQLFGRVLVGLLAVGFGLFLFNNAEMVVAIFIWFSEYMQGS